MNNALATILALASYKHADYFSSLRVVKAIEGKDEAEVKEEKSANLDEVRSFLISRHGVARWTEDIMRIYKNE